MTLIPIRSDKDLPPFMEQVLTLDEYGQYMVDYRFPTPKCKSPYTWVKRGYEDDPAEVLYWCPLPELPEELA